MLQANSPAPLLSAQAIVEKKVSDRTKKQYKAYSELIKTWVAKNHAEYIVEGELQVHQLPLCVIKELFEYYQYHRDKNGVVTDTLSFVSKSRVDFFRKALVFDMAKMKVKPSSEISAFFNEYFKGYSNVIATERHEGRMNEKEGKDPLSGKPQLLFCTSP